MRRRSVLALAAAGLLVLGACGDDGGVTSGDAGGSGSSLPDFETTTLGSTTTTSGGSSTLETTTTTSAIETTTTVGEPTTEATTTTAAPTTTASTTTTTMPATTTTVAPGATPLPDDTNLQPFAGITFTASGDVCADFAPAGWVTESCQSFVALDNFYAIVQRQSGDGHFRVLVLVPTGTPNQYTSEYLAEEPGAGTWASITVVHGSFHFGEGPFNGDAEGLWVGYRYEGTGQFLDLDVIEWQEDGSADRAGLHGLDHGAVHVRPGGADVVTASYAASDPECCPSGFLVRTITWIADEWMIDAGAVVAPGDPAASVTSDF